MPFDSTITMFYSLYAVPVKMNILHIHFLNIFSQHRTTSISTIFQLPHYFKCAVTKIYSYKNSWKFKMKLVHLLWWCKMIYNLLQKYKITSREIRKVSWISKVNKQKYLQFAEKHQEQHLEFLKVIFIMKANLKVLVQLGNTGMERPKLTTPRVLSVNWAIYTSSKIIQIKILCFLKF